MSTENNKKDHADFQDEYRKSSNFSNPIEKENLKPKGNGDVKMAEGLDKMSETDKKKIADAMDSFQQKTEMTPGGEQNDKSKNEEEE